MGSTPQAFLIGSQVETPLEQRLARFLEFYGIGCVPLRAARLADIASKLESERATNGESVCILSHGDTLSDLAARDSNPSAVIERLTRSADHLFAFGFSRSRQADKLLAVLAAGSLSTGDPAAPTEANYIVSSEYPEITAELTGLSFRGPRASSESPFERKNDSAKSSILVTADGKPFVAQFKVANANVFISASGDVVDLDQPCDDAFAFSPLFSRIFPLFMFLREAFRDRMWHTSNHSMANLIIDDPLLRPNYGFVNYESLVRKADELDCTTTLAFIPWNFRRSRKLTTELFRQRSDRLSVCVHGCDHIASEFAMTDLGRLNATVQRANSRMQKFVNSTRLPFAKAMVFPQGRFSPASMMVLKVNGFMGAVNTEATPYRHQGPVLTIADFLDLAITRYHGFPLFRRRYPEHVDDFPFQLFLGNPAFFVEHHGFFKKGFDGLAALARRVAQISPRVRWTSASEILLKSYKVRKLSPTDVDCKLFSRSQFIENKSAFDADFTLRMCEPDGDLVSSVLLNGKPTEFFFERGEIRTTARIPAGASLTFEVNYKNTLPLPDSGQSIKERSKIRIRRYLSEFRDNVIAKNDGFLSAAQALKNKIS